MVGSIKKVLLTGFSPPLAVERPQIFNQACAVAEFQSAIGGRKSVLVNFTEAAYSVSVRHWR